MHGATGAEWEIWRVRYPLGEQTGRVGALDRLRSGLGGRQGCVRRATPGADSRVSAHWVLSVSGLAPSKLIQLAAVRPGLGRGNQLLLAFSRSMLGTAACSCRA